MRITGITIRNILRAHAQIKERIWYTEEKAYRYAKFFVTPANTDEWKKISEKCTKYVILFKIIFYYGGVLILIYQDLISGMERLGSTKRDICMHGIGISPEKVHENVIIAPWWEPSYIPDIGTAEYLSESDFPSVKVWNITSDTAEMTYIKAGIGAPVLMEAILTLGVTSCQQIVFIGSVGALDDNIGIGDIVIPEYSVCGDGASRYISSDSLNNGDIFGEKAYPNTDLFNKSKKVTERICKEKNVKWHLGRTFSIDTVFAQFIHLDEILNMGCNTIEMETAASFRAARLADIPITALFSVSDNTVINKSLINSRTQEEMEYRRYVRRELFPKIILDIFGNKNVVSLSI
ncbi:AMP nucleosidase [Sporanaerobacter sp. PP17-6a]|nr:AMP nucleosidase [Sporanaerobacter sp. PP17-6a]